MEEKHPERNVTRTAKLESGQDPNSTETVKMPVVDLSSPQDQGSAFVIAKIPYEMYTKVLGVIKTNTISSEESPSESVSKSVNSEIPFLGLGGGKKSPKIVDGEKTEEGVGGGKGAVGGEKTMAIPSLLPVPPSVLMNAPAIGEAGQGNMEDSSKKKKKRKKKKKKRDSGKKRSPPKAKGTWTKSEDSHLLTLVSTFGAKKWPNIAEKMPSRNGKQCRERYLNHLDPSINHGEWSNEEDEMIMQMHDENGNSWAKMGRRLKGRPANMIKNRWNSTLWKTVAKRKGVDVEGETNKRRRKRKRRRNRRRYLKKNDGEDGLGSSGSDDDDEDDEDEQNSGAGGLNVFPPKLRIERPPIPKFFSYSPQSSTTNVQDKSNSNNSQVSGRTKTCSPKQQVSSGRINFPYHRNPNGIPYMTNTILQQQMRQRQQVSHHRLSPVNSKGVKMNTMGIKLPSISSVPQKYTYIYHLPKNYSVPKNPEIHLGKRSRQQQQAYDTALQREGVSHQFEPPHKRIKRMFSPSKRGGNHQEDMTVNVDKFSDEGMGLGSIDDFGIENPFPSPRNLETEKFSKSSYFTKLMERNKLINTPNLSGSQSRSVNDNDNMEFGFEPSIDEKLGISNVQLVKNNENWESRGYEKNEKLKPMTLGLDESALFASDYGINLGSPSHLSLELWSPNEEAKVKDQRDKRSFLRINVHPYIKRSPKNATLNSDDK